MPWHEPCSSHHPSCRWLSLDTVKHHQANPTVGPHQSPRTTSIGEEASHMTVFPSRDVVRHLDANLFSLEIRLAQNGGDTRRELALSPKAGRGIFECFVAGWRELAADDGLQAKGLVVLQTHRSPVSVAVASNSGLQAFCVDIPSRCDAGLLQTQSQQELLVFT